MLKQLVDQTLAGKEQLREKEWVSTKSPGHLLTVSGYGFVWEPFGGHQLHVRLCPLAILEGSMPLSSLVAT